VTSTRVRRIVIAALALGLALVVLAWVSVPVAGGYQVYVALFATGVWLLAAALLGLNLAWFALGRRFPRARVAHAVVGAVVLVAVVVNVVGSVVGGAIARKNHPMDLDEAQAVLRSCEAELVRVDDEPAPHWSVRTGDGGTHFVSMAPADEPELLDAADACG
jgi:hypothetical protein